MRAVRSALVVAGTVGIFVAPSRALAQRAHPRPGVAAQAPPVSQPTTPYPGATVTIEPGWYNNRRTLPGPLRRHQQSAPVVYYVPVPSAYAGYSSGGYGGNVYDTNGRPLYMGYYEMQASTPPSDFPIGTPDLSGSPYVVGDGGAMQVDFGNGDRRTLPSCAALESDGTPDGQARTVFYRPPMDGVVLRAGQSGRVIGAPPAGARVCYTVDRYGRMVLDY